MINGVYVSLGVYFMLMIAIGVYGYITTEKDVSGFMLGGRKLGPAVTALSAGASDMSGWILLGLPGLIFLIGINGSWMAIGLTLGAYLNYRLLAPRLRVYTEYLNDAVTIPEYLERRFCDNSHFIRIICAVVIIVFYAIYTTSGLVAGGKLFESSFGITYEIGIYITAAVVVIYSTFGGFLAVSTTDFVQGCIMLVALILVPVTTVLNVGGWTVVEAQLYIRGPELLEWGNLSIIAIISAASWGLGYFGQPHIIVRFMAIRGLKELLSARRIGMSWMIVSIIGTISVGLAGAAYMQLNQLELRDPETIFIILSNTLFHPLISGFLLAAILSAIMSTISSQLLVSSSSIAEDVYYTFLRKQATQSERLLVARLSVIGVAIIAVILAHDRESSILSLVGNAWAGFGSAFGPVILLSLFWSKMTKIGAIAGLLGGAGTVLCWLYLPFTIYGLIPSDFMYEIVPGFLSGTLITILVSLMSQGNSTLEDNFNAMKCELKRQSEK